MFINVITRNLTDPDAPPRHDVINHESHAARVWLAKHSTWALKTGHSVTTYAVAPVPING